MAAMVSEEEPGAGPHWVEELFPPVYGLTMQEVLQGKGPDEDEYDEPPRVQKVSVYNPDSIRNVYERVRVMMAFDEVVRQQSVHADRRATMDTPAGQGEFINIGTLEVKELKNSDIDLNESCIWNTEEITVLRKVFKAAKGEISQLKFQVRELEDRNKRLEAKVTKINKELADKSKGLTEATKANRRLKIHCDTLQEECGTASGKVDMLQALLSEIRTDQASMLTQLHHVRVTLDKERLMRKRIQLQLDSQSTNFAQDKLLAEENVRVSFQQEVADLHKRIEELSEELVGERNVHTVTRKGLDQLRSHFASLPYLTTGPPNAVTKDQVRTVQY